MGHPQPPTPIRCNNMTATGIVNNAFKKQRSQSMEMRFFWITDQVDQKNFTIRWHPGQEMLADYYTKNYNAAHHHRVRPFYVFSSNTPKILPRAAPPSALRGCVENIPESYICRTPLSFVQSPQLHSQTDGCAMRARTPIVCS